MELRAKGNFQGFTLIELLIVVAIIAILAAIAVPNFLEAQTRAKISRAKADMRSTATAIEAYAVDFNRHPIGFWEGNLSDPSLLGHPSVYNLELWIWSTLTTPVAYMTSMVRDPFADKGFFDQGGGSRAFRWNYFKYETSFLKGLGPNGQVPALAFREAKDLGLNWCVYTRGPARREFTRAATIAAASGNTRNNYYPNLVYDPTNGTVSTGLIFRSNKGGN